MADNLTPEVRRKTMQAVKGKRTRLEKRLFSMLAGMGLRGWTQNVDAVIGKPDVAFLSKRVAVFIDGCFWHGCPHCHRKLPQTNRKYWKRKIERNIALAKSTNRRLRADGWVVIRIWEHQMKRVAEAEKIRATIRRSLGENAKRVNNQSR